MVRARPVAGDLALGRRMLEDLAPFVWAPLTDDDRRAIRRMKARIETERVPPGEDPEFHLKLGPGGLVDVEFTAQLLQLEHGIRTTGTIETLVALRAAAALSGDEADAPSPPTGSATAPATAGSWCVAPAPTPSPPARTSAGSPTRSAPPRPTSAASTAASPPRPPRGRVEVLRRQEHPKSAR